MKILTLVLALIGSLFAVPTEAQTILNTTTLAAAIDASQTTITVASTSNITVASTANATGLFVPLTGEYMSVISVPVSGTVQVRRGVSPTRPYLAPTSSVVIIVTSPAALVDYTPGGACTRGSGIARYSPLIDLKTGDVWVCRSITGNSPQWQSANLRPFTAGSTPPFTP